jgi:hypothetical protein
LSVHSIRQPTPSMEKSLSLAPLRIARQWRADSDVCSASETETGNSKTALQLRYGLVATMRRGRLLSECMLTTSEESAEMSRLGCSRPHFHRPSTRVSTEPQLFHLDTYNDSLRLCPLNRSCVSNARSGDILISERNQRCLHLQSRLNKYCPSGWRPNVPLQAKMVTERLKRY